MRDVSGIFVLHIKSAPERDDHHLKTDFRALINGQSHRFGISVAHMHHDWIFRNPRGHPPIHLPNTQPLSFSIRAVVNQFKRDAQCMAISGTNYMSAGAQFDILCDVNWWGNDLYLSHTPDFRSCINECALWNTNRTEKCVGAGWISGQYGPAGVAGGSACYFKWRMHGSGEQAIGVDFARLQIQTQLVLICCELADGIVRRRLQLLLLFPLLNPQTYNAAPEIEPVTSRLPALDSMFSAILTGLSGATMFTYPILLTFSLASTDVQFGIPI